MGVCVGEVGGWDCGWRWWASAVAGAAAAVGHGGCVMGGGFVD